MAAPARSKATSRCARPSCGVRRRSLAALVAGSRPQEIQESRAAVADAKAQHDQAQADWDRAQDLFKNDDISKQQYDQYRMRLDSTAAVLRQAEERLALVVEGPRKEDIDAARAEVVRAKAALQASEANQLELKRREQDVNAHRAEVDRAQAQVAHDGYADQRHRGHSPIDGVVLVKSAEVGEVLAAGTTVVTIGDIDHPWLRAYINETDLGRVKLGPARDAHNRFVSRQILPGAHFVHLVRSRIHSQANSNSRGAREAGLSHQDRRRQPQPRSEIQHAGRRGDPGK